MSRCTAAAFVPTVSLRFSNRCTYVAATFGFNTAARPPQRSRSAASRPLVNALSACSEAPRYSAQVAQLIEQQKQNPIFDPALLHDSLGAQFSKLCTQSPPPFVRSAQLPASASFALRYAVDAIADHTEQAVTAARAYIVRLYPGIDRPRGALWPPERAAACWRDLTAFSRVAAYLAVAEHGLSARGMRVMQHIYYELNVPLDAVRTGVYCVREQLALRAAYHYDSKAAAIVRAAFDQLLQYLRAF